MTERLTCVAIRRGGEVLQRGFQSHWELRYSLDPSLLDPRQTVSGDEDGFYTSEGRFVDRSDAVEVAVNAGQLSPGWLRAQRKLLSSDIDW